MTDTKLLGTPRRRLAAFGAAAVIVLIGALVRPHRDTKTAPVVEQSSAPMLQALVEEQEPIRIFRALRARADEVQEAVARLECASPVMPPAAADWRGAPEPPAAAPRFGVLIGPGEVLVEGGATPAECSLALTNGGSVGVQVPQRGLAIVRAEGLQVPVRLAPGPPVAGQIVFVTGPTSQGRLISPVFVVMADASTASLSAKPAGVASGPLFDSDGRLTAFVLADGTVLTIAAAVAAVGTAPPTNPMGLTLGVSTQRIDGGLDAYFGEQGAIISEVTADGPAARAGLQPGDVIVALADQPVGSPAELATRLESAARAPVPITIVRAGRERRLDIEPAPVGATMATPPALLTGATPVTVLPLDGLPIARLAARVRDRGALEYVEEQGIRYFRVRPASP